MLGDIRLRDHDDVEASGAATLEETREAASGVQELGNDLGRAAVPSEDDDVVSHRDRRHAVLELLHAFAKPLLVIATSEPMNRT